MVSVNGTLFIQLFAFLFAWWFLNRYLLKHLVLLVEQENATQEQIQQSLDSYQQQLATQQHHQKKRWFDFQLLFARNAPKITGSPSGAFGGVPTADTTTSVTTQEKQILQQEAVADLTARIMHGN